MELEKVPFTLLKKIAAGKGARVGKTVNIERRKRQYKTKGCRGTMFYAKTTNMEWAENILLQICPCEDNLQEKSNAKKKEKPTGYVYVIIKNPNSAKCIA